MFTGYRVQVLTPTNFMYYSFCNFDRGKKSGQCLDLVCFFFNLTIKISKAYIICHNNNNNKCYVNVTIFRRSQIGREMSRFLSKNCDNPHEEARRRREVKCSTLFFTLMDGPFIPFHIVFAFLL